MRAGLVTCLVTSLLTLAACSAKSADNAVPGDGGSVSDLPVDPLIAARPFDYQVPPGYSPAQPTPFVILLHGYGANGFLQDSYFHLGELAAQQGFLYAFPDGTADSGGHLFWNATDACCNLDHKDVDDVAYVKAIIRDARARYNVDPKRIYLVGHSNGGFLAHRMACEAADQLAAIVSLAGMTWNDATRCQPHSAVSVLQVHGDADDIIHYTGGLFAPNHDLAVYPSASDTVAQWAQLNHCTGPRAATGMPLDIDIGLPGSETTVERYAGCPQGAVELWTIAGGGHTPRLAPAWPALIYGFLAAHAKP